MSNFGTAVFSATINTAQLAAGSLSARTMLGSISQEAARVGSALTSSITVPIVGLGAAAALESKKIQDAWNEVRKVYNATPSEIEKLITHQGLLGKTVDELTTKYGLNRVEVIGLLGDLAAMGFTGTKATDSLKRGIEFAVAAGIPLEDGLKAVTALVATFQVKGSDLTGVLQGLNAVENETAARGEDLSVALNRAGGNAAALVGPGFSASDAIATIAASMAVFKERGQETYRGANALRRMFQALYAPTDKVAGKLDDLGISLTDAKGNLTPFPQLLQQVADKWPGIAPEDRIALVKQWIGVEFAPLFNQLIDDVSRAQDGTSTFFNSLATYGDKAKGAVSFQRELTIQQNSLAASYGRITAAIQQVLDQPGVQEFFKAIADAVTDVVRWFSELDPKTQKLILAIIGLVAVAGPVALLISAIAAAVSAVSGPVGLVIAGIALLAVAFKQVWDAGGPLVDFLKEVGTVWLQMLKESWADLVSAFNEAKPVLEVLGYILGGVLLLAIGAVVGAIRSFAFAIKTTVSIVHWLIDAIVGGAQTAWETLGNIVSFVGSVIADIASRVAEGFKIWIDTLGDIVSFVWGLVEKVVEFFQWLYDVLVGHSIIPDLVNRILELFNGLVGSLAAIWNTITTAASAAWNGLLEAGRTIWTALTTAISTAVQTVAQYVMTTWNNVVATWRVAFTAMQTVVTTVWNAIKSIVQVAIQFVRAVIDAALQAIRGNWSGAWNTIKSAASSALSAIKSVVSSAISNVKSVISSALNTIKSIWNSTWNGMKNLVSSAVGSITNMIMGLQNTFERAYNAISGFIGGIADRARNILQTLGFSTGGLVPGTGSGDIVPAMLEPGEFVLTKTAVRRIGLSRVQRLNRIGGGEDVFDVVGAPDVSGGGSYSSSGVSSAELPLGGLLAGVGTTRTVHYTFNTTVNNPVAEPASDSVNRRLSKIAALGLLDGGE